MNTQEISCFIGCHSGTVINSFHPLCNIRHIFFLFPSSDEGFLTWKISSISHPMLAAWPTHSAFSVFVPDIWNIDSVVCVISNGEIWPLLWIQVRTCLRITMERTNSIVILARCNYNTAESIHELMSKSFIMHTFFGHPK